MRKRDMYIDYSRSSKRRRSKRSRRSPRKSPKLLPFLVLVVIAVLLGGIAYSLAKDGKISFEIFSKERGKNIKISEDNSGKDTLKDSQDQLSDSSEDNNADQDQFQDKEAETKTQTAQVATDKLEEESLESLEEDDKSQSTRGQPVIAKGIYVTGPVAGSQRMNDLIDMVNNTELNSMVIDVKNDNGEITFNMDHDLVEEIGASVNYIRDIKQLIEDLKDQDIYLIARIVAFKDPLLAREKPEFSLKNPDGSLFLDKAGLGWVNPYKKEVWDYLIEISLEAIELGFDEIQFDYIRFSTDQGMKDVDFGPEAANKSKSDIITEFTQYAYERLSPYAYVSADVYGAIIDSLIDQEIVGQNYLEMAKHLDYICPMIYPSHYADGSYGIEHPDLEPYNLILASLNESKNVLAQVEEGSHVAKVRSWLQDFTATWISNYQSYGPTQIREQIQAVYDSGHEEWILWNGSNNYTRDGLLDE